MPSLSRLDVGRVQASEVLDDAEIIAHAPAFLVRGEMARTAVASIPVLPPTCGWLSVSAPAAAAAGDEPRSLETLKAVMPDAIGVVVLSPPSPQPHVHTPHCEHAAPEPGELHGLGAAAAGKLHPRELVALMQLGDSAADTSICATALKALIDFTGGCGVKIEREASLTGFGSSAEVRIASAIDVGAPAVVVAAMRRHPSAANVIEWGCRALFNLSNCPVGATAALQEGAADAIIDAMLGSIDNSRVAEWGCLALYKIRSARAAAADAAADATTDEARACGLIVGILRAHKANPDVCCAAILALREYSVSSEGKHAAADANATTAVVAAMRIHAIDEQCTEWACSLLTRITSVPAGHSEALAVGAPAVVIAAMKNHAGSMGIMKNACSAIATLAAPQHAAQEFVLSGVASSSDAPQALVDAGAAPAVVAALLTHGPSNAGAAYWGCAALDGIASAPVGAQAALDAGAPAASLAAMRWHATDEDVAARGCRSLTNVGFPLAGKQAIIVAGGPAVVLQAMQAHPASEDVAVYGCWVIGNVGACASGSKASIDAGALDIISAALLHHASSEMICLNGCAALNNLLIHGAPATRAAAISAGAPKSVVVAISASVTVSWVAKYGSSVLLMLSDTPVGMSAVVAADGAAVAIKAMLAHAGDPEVAETGCSLLNLMVQVSFPEGRKAVRRAGGVAAVSAAIARHPASVIIRLKGNSVIRLLSNT